MLGGFLFHGSILSKIGASEKAGVVQPKVFVWFRRYHDAFSRIYVLVSETSNTDAASMIRFERVCVTVQQKNILHDIRFNLSSGEKAALCGKSGSGKSSILKTVMGLHVLQSGAVYVRNELLNARSIYAIRNRIAYIGQEPMLGAEDVREALLLPFRFDAHRAQLPEQSRLLEVLQRLQLPTDILDAKCSRISGGEKQRIALARGLLLDKRLYLLDEVTSALDRDSKQAVFEVFADPQLTVLSVTHDPDWLGYCQTIFELDAGCLNRRTDNGNA
jgi:putative ABC transport system ATP-binding protein